MKISKWDKSLLEICYILQSYYEINDLTVPEITESVFCKAMWPAGFKV